MKKKENNGFTLIELLAVIVVLAIIMIIAIPNILTTMNTSKTSSFKVEAQKMFNEASKKYEEEGLSGVTVGGTGSAFTKVGNTYTIGISSDLAGAQNKYSGCVIITPQSSGNVAYKMYIYMSDGEFTFGSDTAGVEESALKSATPDAYASSYDTNRAAKCGAEN